MLSPSTYPGTRYAYQKYSLVGQRISSCSSKEESTSGKKPIHSWEKLVAVCCCKYCCNISAPFARLMIFSFVAWPSPVCGSLSLIFTSLHTFKFHEGLRDKVQVMSVTQKRSSIPNWSVIMVLPHQLYLQAPVSTTSSYPSPITSTTTS